MKIYDVIILGAGASGLMCASHLDKNLDVAIVDINEKVAKKLKISGGGKCNITNVDVSEYNYDGDGEIIEYALSIFSKEDLLHFLDRNGVEPVIRKGRYYFCKESSDEVIDILKRETKYCKTVLNTEILTLIKNENIFELQTSKGLFKAKKVVVATGGKSFKSLGASDIGLQIAKSFNIQVKEFTPALVGMTLQPAQFWMKELSGLSCYVHIRVDNKVLKEDMLFAHKGISGPAILSTSLYWKNGDISIDFLPDQNILELVNGRKKRVSSVINLPKRLSKAILDALDVEDIECNKLDTKSLKKLKNIHNYRFAPAGNFGFTKAEVCRGGVLAWELNRYTLESLDIEGLYFIGEVVDVTGELGGYNFQWAFSSAIACANNL
ncbi:MAG: aminoacetone oxidase family FAD-binding enzyme [Campylobacterota bacterium]|nr:aminoacetone oxidase family FAD-binding enzyme [Campylobacterota bacterium]